VFNCVIDTVISQLTQRFTATNNIAAKFSVILPQCFVFLTEHYAGKIVLCALPLFSIKAESAELMKTEKLIDSFASAKARKKKFF